jgi:hypothetical protein
VLNRPNSSASITLSIPALLARVPKSPDAITHIDDCSLGGFGKLTTSLTLNPFLTSISFKTIVKSTDCSNLRLEDSSRAF